MHRNFHTNAVRHIPDGTANAAPRLRSKPMNLFKHSVYNLLGLGLPLVVAVFTIPVLIKELGEARFGLLTLIWAVVSYFGLFDLGLGRALTQQLAVVLAKNKHDEVGPLVGTATVLMAALGLVAGLLMAGAASWGVGLINAVPDKQEATRAVYAMALAMPFIVLTSGFRGILEASHAFGEINMIRLPMGLFTFVGPLTVVIYGQARLDWIAAVLVVVRVLACVVHAYYAWCVLPRDRGRIGWHNELLKPLCVSGGWLTVSNIISPFMGYVDRFVIGAIVSASAVAYYATPLELVTKLWIVPGALTAVLFPTFAIQMAQRDQETWVLYKKAVHWLFVALLPVTVALALFSHEILAFWISPEFASHSAVLLQIFAVGIFANCLAHVPLTLIQSAGAARITALTHSAELPFFLAALWWLSSVYGVLGAAIAWLLRIALDTLLVFGLCSRLLGRPSKELFDGKTLGMTLLAGVCFAGMLIEVFTVRVAWTASCLAIAVATLATQGVERKDRV
jgi:O-antigen/teichoic acid export membrane protein